jgi:FKBP-type peptidyl-prolyl cis-trans isomerase
MKNILKIQYILIFLLFYSCSSETVQSEQTSREPIVTFQDSLSYTMGVNIGQNLPETEINHDLLIEGLQDFWSNEEPRLNAPTRLEILRAFNITNSEIEREVMRSLSEKSKQLSRENKMKGKEFLDNNKFNEGVKVFSRSQIQYKIINEGNGPIPDFDDAVVVHYDGYLIDGQKFDSSYDRGEPATFSLNGIIQGWQLILQKMPVGSKWQVFIPEHLGYGIAGVYKDAKKGEYIIPPSSTLIFDIELISIVE